jgi:hypothetical protein
MSSLLETLQLRFEKNMARHADVTWELVSSRLKESHLRSLEIMEESGGEPDVVSVENNEILFFDCSPESPKGRRSLCYDQAALDGRKEYKPANSAVSMALSMGIELLTEEQFHHLQTLGEFDLKTSSWLKTDASIRKLGGAIFGDRRYGRVFIFHNGAESYYSSRGFRGVLRV